jgi:hypothetical protein
MAAARESRSLGFTRTTSEDQRQGVDHQNKQSLSNNCKWPREIRGRDTTIYFGGRRLESGMQNSKMVDVRPVMGMIGGNSMGMAGNMLYAWYFKDFLRDLTIGTLPSIDVDVAMVESVEKINASRPPRVTRRGFKVRALHKHFLTRFEGCGKNTTIKLPARLQGLPRCKLQRFPAANHHKWSQ